MSGFRKAKAEQAAVKMAIYGPSGSGKTFTSLLIAEGLAKLTKKRIAFIDTEHGTDFYAKAIPDRRVHPEEFDFDAIYTRSLVETLDEVRGLSMDTHSVIVLDSITHMWEAARAAYAGKLNKADQIPISAWSKIKKPYKDLVAYLMSSPAHIIICGRQGINMSEEDGEMVVRGVKMKAEGETQYEPHITIRMEDPKVAKSEPLAIFEKDRTGILQAKAIPGPNFENTIAKIVPYLGLVQAKIESEDETAAKDAEGLASADAARESESANLLKEWRARLDIASTKGAKALSDESKAITPAIKKQMLPSHVGELREHCLALMQKAGAA